MGFSGEASQDVHLVADFAAEELAMKHLTYFRMTMANAKALFRHRLHRKWGHTFALGFARVMLERLRDHVGDGPAPSRFRPVSDPTAADANEEFAFFRGPLGAG